MSEGNAEGAVREHIWELIKFRVLTSETSPIALGMMEFFDGKSFYKSMMRCNYCGRMRPLEAKFLATFCTQI